MRVAIDGMGGDLAPREVVRGIIEARNKGGPAVIVTGDEKTIRTEFEEQGGIPEGVETAHTQQVVSMDEPPSRIFKEKKDSSLVKGAELVKEGYAAAYISGGNTGAVMAAGIFAIGRHPNIERPGIATPLPGLGRMAVLIDAGANSECKPQHLLQFAALGSRYMTKIYGREKPRIGLLNVGEEENKGTPLFQATYKLLMDSRLNFLGNVEGRNILSGEYDVIVCDGFTGNVTLKVTEGTAATIVTLLKNEIEKSLKAKVGALLMKDALSALKARLDYEEYGGAPLLGLQAPVIICHGSSKAKAFMNAIFLAAEMANKKVHDIGDLLE